MTVHILMPVYNRLEHTREMLGCLRGQKVDEPISQIVIDDGSTDGTSEYLLSQSDVTVIQGDGSLWWGGAIQKGLKWVLSIAAPEDWVLFVNNDTHISPDFIQRLLNTARKYAPAAVGSVIRDREPPHRLLSIGPYIDPIRMLVTDILDSGACSENEDVMPVDALSGRGVLFPIEAMRAVNGLRPAMLPHYLADYELALRVKRAGWRLVVDLSATVYSCGEDGSLFRAKTWRQRFFSVRSPSYLPAQLGFWWQASNLQQRLTMPFRLLTFLLFPSLRKKA